MVSGNEVTDLSSFEQAVAQLPGVYLVDIYLNGSYQVSKDVKFISTQYDADNDNSSEHPLLADEGAGKKREDIHDETGLMACLTKKNLVEMGINTSMIPALKSQQDDHCLSPGKYIAKAFTSFDFQKMRLDISIPQVAMQSYPDGWISPELWDEGINAALLSYQFSGSENRGTYGNSSSHYLNLNSGVNLGAWRLRDNSTWSDYKNHHDYRSRWQHINTYIQRAIIPFRSELTMGESITSSDVFDSISYRGVNIATDDSMYPDTMRGYAPEIKGIAYSNAQVSVRQHGNVIFRTFVAAGAFVINEIYPVSSGGDLELEIRESDGTSHVVTIPFSSVPVLQRKGHVRYALTAGRFRNSSSRYASPSFAEGTLLWGLPHNTTLYGGAQLAENYRSVAVGTGINLGVVGAVSADITHADSELMDGSHHQGQSVRLQYGRSMVSTGTTLQLAGYRFYTPGFHTLDETALKGMSGWLYENDNVELSGKPAKQDWNNYYNLSYSKRDRLQVNISQRIGNHGSLYVTGSRQTYWGNAATSNTLQTGYNSHWGNVSYGLSYNFSKVSGQPNPDKALYFSLSVPLDVLLTHKGHSEHQTWANMSASRDSDGKINQQAGLSGTVLDENNLDWSLSQGYGKQAGGNGDASIGYKGTYGNVSAGYGYSKNYRQFRYGASGGMVLTGNGITLGQPLGTTNVFVAVPGAADVPVENQNGIHTDWRGYTVLPYASIYRKNRVALDASHLDDEVDIDDAVTHVIPTRGALVRAKFSAHKGGRAVMTLIHNGKPIPFGATVSVSDQSSNGMVGDDGEVYLSGLSQKGSVLAKWGNGPDQHCTAQYNISNKTALTQIQEVCR